MTSISGIVLLVCFLGLRYVEGRRVSATTVLPSWVSVNDVNNMTELRS